MSAKNFGRSRPDDVDATGLTGRAFLKAIRKPLTYGGMDRFFSVRSLKNVPAQKRYRERSRRLGRNPFMGLSCDDGSDVATVE